MWGAARRPLKERSVVSVPSTGATHLLSAGIDARLRCAPSEKRTTPLPLTSSEWPAPRRRLRRARVGGTSTDGRERTIGSRRSEEIGSILVDVGGQSAASLWSVAYSVRPTRAERRAGGVVRAACGRRAGGACTSDADC
eukprot:scaffold264604_cov31-Tisochrysis_lutea.AAC.3